MPQPNVMIKKRKHVIANKVWWYYDKFAVARICHNEIAKKKNKNPRSKTIGLCVHASCNSIRHRFILVGLRILYWHLSVSPPNKRKVKETKSFHLDCLRIRSPLMPRQYSWQSEINSVWNYDAIRVRWGGGEGEAASQRDSVAWLWWISVAKGVSHSDWKRRHKKLATKYRFYSL